MAAIVPSSFSDVSLITPTSDDTESNLHGFEIAFSLGSSGSPGHNTWDRDCDPPKWEEYCDDSNDCTFFVSDEYGKREKCIWLKARPAMQKILCVEGSEASSVCPETCGVCSDSCVDSQGVFFEVDGVLRDCLWLSLRPNKHSSVCSEGGAAFEHCQDVCNRCDKIQDRKRDRGLRKISSLNGEACVYEARQRKVEMNITVVGVSAKLVKEQADIAEKTFIDSYNFLSNGCEDVYQRIVIGARIVSSQVIAGPQSLDELKLQFFVTLRCNLCPKDDPLFAPIFDQAHKGKPSVLWNDFELKFGELFASRLDYNPSEVMVAEMLTTVSRRLSETRMNSTASSLWARRQNEECTDTERRPFYVDKELGYRDCDWLYENPNFRPVVCLEGADASALCPEVCGFCSDITCYDSAYPFEVEGEQWWCSSMSKMSREARNDACASSVFVRAFCKETCDLCPLGSTKKWWRHRRKW